MNDRPSGKGMREDDIDAHLKKAFEALTEEGVPKRFADLLERLKAEEGESAQAEDDDTEQPQAQSAGGAGRT